MFDYCFFIRPLTAAWRCVWSCGTVQQGGITQCVCVCVCLCVCVWSKLIMWCLIYCKPSFPKMTDSSELEQFITQLCCFDCRESARWGLLFVKNTVNLKPKSLWFVDFGVKLTSNIPHYYSKQKYNDVNKWYSKASRAQLITQTTFWGNWRNQISEYVSDVCRVFVVSCAVICRCCH